jgi:L-seryl-tRNA(Ser) seleniumtransferase
MVEIGGDFRVPDVLALSGAKLREVGTTNRTKLADFENATGPETRMILRVHPSNYRIIGFTAMPSVVELAELASRHNLILYVDLGSGALVDLKAAGFGSEPPAGESIADGADLITFSGDKLLGGPQAGIVAGKREYIEILRRHPLYRALRVDKLTIAALEATLDSYLRDAAIEEIPVLRMLSVTREQITERAGRMIAMLSEKEGLAIDLIDGVSAVGGGGSPDVQPETTLIALSHPTLTAAEIESRLRLSDPPVIARIADDRVLIDLRTVAETEIGELARIIDMLA